MKTDKQYIEEIGSFIKVHRLEQNKTQTKVANDAGISRSTLSLLERGENISLDNLLRVLRVLDLLYVLDGFHYQQQISPIEYAKIRKKQRKHASPQQVNEPGDFELGW